MRNCIYLLCLAPVLVYSTSSLAHPPEPGKKVAWHCMHFDRPTNWIFENYGERTTCGVREEDRGSYLSNRANLNSSDYDNVLVIYNVRNNREQRHDHREPRHTLSYGIAHQFSEYRLSEVTIERSNQSRSHVIDVDDIRGVILTHSKHYGWESFNESALHKLGEEWQQRFPTADGQVYKYSGPVLLVFSDNNVLIKVHEVSRGGNEPTPLQDHPLVLIDKRYLVD